MRTILVAVDDSEASQRVVQFVNRFFDGLDVSVLAVSVAARSATWMPASTPYGWVYAWPALESAEALDELQAQERARAEQAIDKSGLIDDDAVVDVGDPATVILQAAEDHHADLIVVGSNHKNVFERLVFGSVSRELVRDSGRPVVVVP